MAERNKGGRPSPGKCVYNLRFRLTQEDKDLFDAKYAASGCRSRKDFFIQILNHSDGLAEFNEANKQSRQDVRNLESDIYHTANNVNQIAHFLNSAGYTASDTVIKEKLNQMLEYLPNLQSKLKKIDSLINNFKF